MTTDHAYLDPSRLSRRQLLKAGGLTLGALAVGQRAAAQILAGNGLGKLLGPGLSGGEIDVQELGRDRH